MTSQIRSHRVFNTTV